MAAPLTKTKTPGIYKRGSRYVFSYRLNGKQHWESCRTLDDARRAKSARNTDIDRGELEERSKVTLHDYVLGTGDEDGWIDTYRGTGKRGFREETREEYRGLLNKYALQYFKASVLLVDIKPAQIDKFIGWLVKQPNGRKGTLSDKSVRNALGPLMACLAHAKRVGLIPTNPALGAALPHRDQIEDDEKIRPFPDGTMEIVVSLVHPDHRVMFELLAATGFGVRNCSGSRSRIWLSMAIGRTSRFGAARGGRRAAGRSLGR